MDDLRSYRGKRLLDLTITLLLAVPAALIGMVCAVAIYVDSGRPITFRQERVGYRGRLYGVLKFRTMIDAPNPLVPDDARITRVGRWLRRMSLDEVPQLINVVRGEMSLVGPRPALPYTVMRLSDRQRRRLQVRPGMTGLAAVRGRNALTWAQRIDYDLEYLETQSARRDIALLFATIRVVAGGVGVGGHLAGDPLAAQDDQVTDSD